MVSRITVKSVLEFSYVCIKSFVDTTKITNKKDLDKCFDNMTPTFNKKYNIMHICLDCFIFVLLI